MTGRFPIVGVGASAGGLEAVSKLLAHLPADTGMAFVVVQHLDPARESFLPELLQKATEMPVSQAKEGVRVAPNHVYVIPPNAHMCVAGGRLRLKPRPEGVHAMAVNCFLSSLAEERGESAIAVILSGTASDGALGVKAVKAEGGSVFAQDERSAVHAGMPQSAAATGAVDYVLPPEEIAAALARLALHPAAGRDSHAVFKDSRSLDRIFAALRRVTAVDFGLYKSSTIRRRLLRRLSLHRLESLDQYAELVEKAPDEVRALCGDLLIHVTYFFREPAALEALRAKAFPRILKGLGPDAPIRVWVPGCSSGEEAYTLAILLLDFLGERGSMNPLQVFATDISESALEKARAGVYPEDVRTQVPPKLLRRFFNKVDRGYEIVKRVRDLCVFAKHDLTKDPPFANVDLISCCNVLIYLGQEAQNKVLPVFHYSLRPWGALVLSNAESVGEFGRLFAAADKKSRLYYKKPVPSKVSFPADVRSARLQVRAPASGSGQAAWPETNVQKVADRLLLARFAPAGVIIGGDLGILHFRGRVNRYLEPATGAASLNLLKMLPAHSAGALKALIQKARKSDAPAKAGGMEVGGDGDSAVRINIEVVPFRLPTSGERYYIVLFEDEPPPGAGPKAGRGRQAPLARREGASVRRLKSELASTRGYLQTLVEDHEAANEELKSANEEIISSNEELQSTNEELEIAKEELQAANEELNTLNEELQTRNADLGQLNNDLLNLLSSVHLPIIMVTTDLRIRRFTPLAEKVINLIPGDVGRPIGDIKLKIALPNIEEIILDVIETVTSKELEVHDSAGRPYFVQVRPYKTAENKIEGAVILFVEDDPVKRSILEIQDVSAFEAVLDMVREPLAVLDARMRVKAVSRSMYQAFGLTQSQLGRSLFQIEGGRWNAPELRSRLERLADRGEPFSEIPIRVDGRDLRFSARRIESRDGGPPLILLDINQQG